MPAKKKSTRRRYSQGASKTVASAMRRKKRGTLKSGKGGKGGTVESRKQAIAIGLSKARKKGARVPRKKRRSRKIRHSQNACVVSIGSSAERFSRGTCLIVNCRGLSRQGTEFHARSVQKPRLLLQ